jgi:hypothetical protein
VAAEAKPRILAAFGRAGFGSAVTRRALDYDRESAEAVIRGQAVDGAE